jgi:hypothetical protein
VKWNILKFESHTNQQRMLTADIILVPESLLSAPSRDKIQDTLAKFHYDRIIVDEAQGFKNILSRKTQILKRLVENCSCLWLLTATPITTSLWYWGTYLRLFERIKGWNLPPAEEFEKVLRSRRASYSEDILGEVGPWIRPLLLMRTRRTTIRGVPIVDGRLVKVTKILIEYDAAARQEWESHLREVLDRWVGEPRCFVSLMEKDIKTSMGAYPGHKWPARKLKAAVECITDELRQHPDAKILVFSQYPDCLARLEEVDPIIQLANRSLGTRKLGSEVVDVCSRCEKRLFLANVLRTEEAAEHREFPDGP